MSSNNQTSKTGAMNNMLPSNGMRFVSSPSDFDGRNSNEAERWLIKLKQILKVNKVEDIETIMAIASSYLKDRALDWWFSIQESVESFGQFEDLFKKKFMKVIYEKAWKELKTVQQRPDEDVEGISNRLRQLFRAAGVTDEGTKKAIFVASVLPGLGYEMEKVLSNRKKITFEDLVDEATEHELLLVKYDRKKVDMYGLQKKSVAFEVDNSVHGISKDTMSEVSSINSVLSDLVNEMRALKISTVEQKELIQQQQTMIAQHNMVLQGGGNNSGYGGYNGNASYQRNIGGQRSFNDACFNCGEPGHMVRNCPYPPRRRQHSNFNGNGGNSNNGSGIVGQPHGNTNYSNNESNEMGKDMGHQ